ncbi:competence protein ComFB [Bacillus sp. SORGH_AS 510]|uniref:late competence development ComFB family protein n=1 Tax=Bacillus sp. SORGH_AS_0510 TaxID=3041771 RepID=UPI0027801A5B|nr:late competence development ComFB family protein [Bacillus sp. SORGH_AS_0510]MDQ1143848.1 competence protein ComFB [Bacillus sp. SORGH_AS_0510]
MDRNYINVMEEFVESLVTFLLLSPDFQLFCKCQKCRTDIIAYSLNNLPHHYVTTEDGRKTIFEQLNNDLNRKWINKKIISAIYLVGQYPKH